MTAAEFEIVEKIIHAAWARNQARVERLLDDLENEHRAALAQGGKDE